MYVSNYNKFQHVNGQAQGFVKRYNEPTTKQLFRILLISLFYICKFIFLLLLFPLLFYQLFLFIPAINVMTRHITLQCIALHGRPDQGVQTRLLHHVQFLPLLPVQRRHREVTECQVRPQVRDLSGQMKLDQHFLGDIDPYHDKSVFPGHAQVDIDEL